MKEKKIDINYNLPIIVILLAVIVWAMVGIFQEDRKPELVKISVIVEDSNSAKWNSFKKGMETAAKDSFVDLNLVSTSRYGDADEVRSLVEQRVNDGTEGIILSPYGSENLDEYYESLSWEDAICLVASGTKSMVEDNNIQSVLADNQKINEMILNQVKADFGQQLRGKQVVLYSELAHQASIKEGMENLGNVLSDAGCTVISVTEGFEQAEKLLKSFRTHGIVIAFDDDSLTTAAKALYGNEKVSASLYGIGISESSIYYLDKGCINGMIVPDDFNMGYESVTLVAEHIRNKHLEKQNITIDSFAVRPEDVHNPEIERKLFPDIQ